jgi:hypothetical protein
MQFNSDPSNDVITQDYFMPFDNNPVQVYDQQIVYIGAQCCVCIAGYTFKVRRVEMDRIRDSVVPL